jgi:hypothetical protein
MDRRRFVGAFAGGLVIARSVAFAQPAAKVYRIGFFLGASGDSVASLFGAFSEGLAIRVRRRTQRRLRAPVRGRHMDRLPEIAAELVRLRVDVIVTGSSIHVAAARQTTKRYLCHGLQRTPCAGFVATWRGPAATSLA